VRDIKVRDESVPFSSTAREPENAREGNQKQCKTDRHAELKKRGEEKKRLLAKLRPAIVSPTQKDEEDTPVFPNALMDSSHAKPRTSIKQSSPVARLPTLDDLPIKKKKKKRNATIDSPTDSHVKKVISKPGGPASKHTEHKRQKMREREKEKRNKLREKKIRKLEISKSKQKPLSQTQKVTTTPLEGPSDTLKELGMKLSAKLDKERKVYEKAYSSISHRSY
jgi:hypothetical protein